MMTIDDQVRDGQVRPFPFRAPDEPVPPEEFRILREHEPVSRVVLPTGDLAWLITRHADVRAVLADNRFSRAAAEAPDAPRLANTRPGARTILGMDPPDHTRMRTLVMRAFTARRIEALRPRIQEIAETQARLALVAPRPVDLLSCYALSVPIKVIFELLGVPLEDADQLHAWSDVIFSLHGHTPEQVGDAREQIRDYLRELIARRREQPTEDLIGLLVHARDEAGSLSEDELVDFALILMTVGHQSTSNSIATALYTLLTHPEALARLRQDRALIPRAVEELLRHNPFVLTGTQLRVALADVEVAGVTIRSGEAVIAALGSANHDGAVFEHPDELDLDRGDNPHLAFGFGVHHCLGAQLARVELQVALDTLIQALPAGVRLAVPADWLTWKVGLTARAPANLPVTW
jgi:cytochrome P450